MRTCSLTLGIPVGLHARPAAQFVAMAQQFESDVLIGYAGEEDSLVDAKRPIDVLGLDANQGDQLVLETEGPDEQSALEELSKFLVGKER
jgi:phosphotransferase system HPr (HPr) family protein